MLDHDRYEPHHTYGELVVRNRAEENGTFEVVGSDAPIMLVEGRLTAGWTDEQICGWEILGLTGREETIAAIRVVWSTLPSAPAAFAAALRRSVPLVPTVVADRDSRET